MTRSASLPPLPRALLAQLFACAMAVSTGASATGRWQDERRDIAADAATAFGGEGVELTLLAVATDTDNTGERARAGVADLHFVAHGAQCRFPPDTH